MSPVPLLLAIACALAIASPAAGAKVVPFFDAPVMTSMTVPFHITVHGNFSEGYAFRLTQNTTDCNKGSYFAAGQTPTGTISNVIEWTRFDPAKFFVLPFTATQVGHQIRVCYSNDGKRSWAPIDNNRGRRHFHLWRQLPVITRMLPATATVNQPMYLTVPNLPPGAVAALTTRRDGCDGEKVANAIPGANRSVYNYRDRSFAFTPRVAAAKVFLCVATPPTEKDWSLVPFDLNQVTSDRGHSSEPVSGFVPKNFGPIAINPAATRFNRGVLACGPFVGGAEVRCRLQLVNRTALTLAASDLAFSRLTDGAGDSECPFPPITQVASSTQEVEFRWTPQRFGRGGAMGFTYKGAPLFLRQTAWSLAWLRTSNSTMRLAKGDDSYLRFLVQPGFSHLHAYPYANLVDFAYFGPSPNWVFAKGVPGSVNATTADEALAATLRDGVLTGTLSRATAIPARSTMCLANLRYYYSAQLGPITHQSVQVGAVTIMRDAVTLHSYEIYATGASLSVIKNGKRTRIVGDMQAWESLTAEIEVDTTQHSTITVSFTATHTLTVKKMFYSGVSLRCSGAVATPAPEVRALRRIYDYVGASSPALSTWRSGGAFNGDPCVNHWAGVECRNMHVVGVELTGANLVGALPQVPELVWLERLVLKRNSLSGTVPSHLANLTRLTHLDLSQNGYTAIPRAVLSNPSHRCLKTALFRHNQIGAFPQQARFLPALEHLDLSNNIMRGGVQDWSPNAPLIHLDVSRNSLTGGLPDMPIESLVTADFGSNGFNGTVPAQWGALKALRYLDVSKNQLGGVLPLELSRIRSGHYLTFHAEENYFHGTLPRLPFRTVDVRDNVFHCPLPKAEGFVLTSHYGGMDTMECDFGPMP